MFLDANLFLDPVILIVLAVFFSILFYFVKNVIKIKSTIENLTNFLKTFKKSDLLYRFKELDERLSQDSFISNYWIEFKNTLVFNENNFSIKQNENQAMFDPASQKASAIQCTVDSVYFFNEETLIHSKLNYKFISTVPTILTGMGPLFTFLNISLAFSKVDFASQETTLASISQIMASMKVAAMVSVVAVATSILFIITERLLYNNMCKKPLQSLQLEINKLFENISSEKFLIELLKETKRQNYAISSSFERIPEQMQKAFDKSITTNLVPYLDNLIFTINKLQENSKGSTNILNELFNDLEK